MDLFALLQLWFGLIDRVGRLPYFATGLSLMVLKYLVEASLIRVCTGATFTPLDFINPLLSVRSSTLATGPEWLSVFLIAWSFPFLWIALSMSVRRAADAGLSPWAGLMVLVPLMNLLFMIIMCFVPSQPDARWMLTSQQATTAHELRSTMFGLLFSCPERARIDGRGVGLTRYCVFTTGTFVEPITVWQPGRRLAFDVTDQPAPMFELSPYRHVHPPHLDGYLRSRRGEFLLVELPGGRTRLEGRTWYSLAMFPQPYWTLWSDAVIHRIHLRVLRHIKKFSESEGAASDCNSFQVGCHEAS